jgi:hypothetical protein
MAKGAWTSTQASSQVIAADVTRTSLTVQMVTAASSPTSLAFGAAAVFGEGVQLVNIGDSVTVRGHLAQLAVYGICDTGLTSGGGYQTT